MLPSDWRAQLEHDVSLWFACGFVDSMASGSAAKLFLAGPLAPVLAAVEAGQKRLARSSGEAGPWPPLMVVMIDRSGVRSYPSGGNPGPVIRVPRPRRETWFELESSVPETVPPEDEYRALVVGGASGWRGVSSHAVYVHGLTDQQVVQLMLSLTPLWTGVSRPALREQDLERLEHPDTEGE